MRLTIIACLALVDGAFADDELKAIAAMVKASQQAGFESHGFEKYIAPWADGSVMIYGRGEKAGEHDNIMPFDKLRAVRKLRMSGPRPKVILTYWDESYKREGDIVSLRWTARASEPRSYELTDEIYRLKKIGGDWKIIENRAWITEARWEGEKTRYDKGRWERLDAEVEAARDNRGPLATASALMAAFRFGEAHTAARAILGSSPAFGRVKTAQIRGAAKA